MTPDQQRKLNAVVQLNDALMEFGNAWSLDNQHSAMVKPTGFMLNELLEEVGPDMLIIICAWLSIECERMMALFAEEGIKNG